MLTKKTDNYKNIELSDTLNGIEIDMDGLSEDLETFLKEENKNDDENNEENKSEEK